MLLLLTQFQATDSPVIDSQDVKRGLVHLVIGILTKSAALPPVVLLEFCKHLVPWVIRTVGQEMYSEVSCASTLWNDDLDCHLRSLIPMYNYRVQYSRWQKHKARWQQIAIIS